jgi:hypothetical protein
VLQHAVAAVQERQDLLVDAFDVIIHSEDAEGADEG